MPAERAGLPLAAAVRLTLEHWLQLFTAFKSGTAPDARLLVSGTERRLRRQQRSLSAMVAWGDRYYAPNGPPRVLVHADCGGELEQHLTCGSCGAEVKPRAISTRSGPGAGRVRRPSQPPALARASKPLAD